MKAQTGLFFHILPLLLGHLFLSAGMVAIFFQLGFRDGVISGAVLGVLLALLNHLLLVLGTLTAASKAARQDVRGGQASLRLSYGVRMLGLFLVLLLLGSSGQFHPLALTLPLLFTRPILAVLNRIQTRKGDCAA